MIELIQQAPLISLGLLAIGVVLGLLAGNFLLPSARRAQRLQREIETLQGDRERYERRVTEHFQTTAVLVGDLTSSYKAVYEHLAAGARTLSDPALAAHGFGTPRLIVDGAEHDRLPREPLAHDTTPVSEHAPSTGGPTEPTDAPAPEIPRVSEEERSAAGGRGADDGMQSGSGEDAESAVRRAPAEVVAGSAARPAGSSSP